jgi:endo-cleaving rubber dioxygenase
MPLIRVVVAGAAALLLSACGGSSTNGSPAGEQASQTATSGSSQEFFQTRLQTSSGFCRTCHVPGGVADVDGGRKLLLSSSGADDYEQFYAAWQALGEGVASNALLTMPSDPALPHSGGKPWPESGAEYQAMFELLSCWETPETCSLNVGQAQDQNEWPLLGSTHGGHYWFDYCGDDGNGAPRPDSAALPIDPRALVVPGVNEGRAVAFNGFWKDCHVDPELVGESPQPQTCGELRASYARGARLMEGNGNIDAGTTFAGQSPHGIAALPAEQYNKLWRVWGLSERPDNFDQLVVERYGYGPILIGPQYPRNPYPLPGEDPNMTNGGSGTLPQGLTQTRLEDGRYSGYISQNCKGCHSLGIETDEGFKYYSGGGGAMLDASTASRDWAMLGDVGTLAIERLGFGGRTRGTNNAQFANVVAALGAGLDKDALGWLTSGSTASGDTPAYWNVGRRPVKYFDAMFSGDGVRVDNALFFPLLDKNPLLDRELPGIFDIQGVYEWMSDWVQSGDHWIIARKSPEYPGEIDTALAEQGAILFHTKDLWANGNVVARPDKGNGSCASCHGAYSPRFVDDPAFLETPMLEGIASYVTPIEIIDTDRVRLDTFNDGTNRWLSNSFVGYSETAGTEQDCRVQNLPGMQVDANGNERPRGYAAPPLFGVWVTAPYFHNGSVPNLDAVLDSTQRPEIWRRKSKPARPDQAGKVVMGYDNKFERAYDQEKGGWKYDQLQCGGSNLLPYLDCTPLDPLVDLLVEDVLGGLIDGLFGNLIGIWGITNPVTLTNGQIEARKIYNTGMFSQGNGGHEFSDVLNANERRALIEYLKTL